MSNRDAILEALSQSEVLGAMHRLASRQLGSNDDADDVVQSAIGKALTRSEQLNEPRAAKSWLLTITRNGCMDILRERRRQRALTSEYGQTLEWRAHASESDRCELADDLISIIRQDSSLWRRLKKRKLEEFARAFLNESDPLALSVLLSTTPKNIRAKKSRLIRELKNHLVNEPLKWYRQGIHLTEYGFESIRSYTNRGFHEAKIADTARWRIHGSMPVFAKGADQVDRFLESLGYLGVATSLEVLSMRRVGLSQLRAHGRETHDHLDMPVCEWHQTLSFRHTEQGPVLVDFEQWASIC